MEGQRLDFGAAGACGSNARRAAVLAAAAGDQLAGGGQQLGMQVVQPLRKPQALRKAIVERDGRPLGLARSDLHHRSQVARIAHQIQRGDVAQRIAEATERAARPAGGFGALVACRAQGHEIVKLVGQAVVAVLAWDVTELAKWTNVVHIMRAGVPLGSAALAAAVTVAGEGSLACLAPGRAVVVGGHEHAFRLQAFDGLGSDPQPIGACLIGALRQVDGTVAQRFMRVTLDLAVGTGQAGNLRPAMRPPSELGLVCIIRLQNLQID